MVEIGEWRRSSPSERVAGIILAGGASRRMGANKALLSLNGESLIERTVRCLEQVCGRILLSANDPDSFRHLGVECVPDVYPGQGPMAGIHAALMTSDRPWNMVAACDMPFISPALLGALLGLAEAGQGQGDPAAAGPEAVIPVIQGRIHPLLALYRKETAAGLERRLQEGELRMTDWVEELDALLVPEDQLEALMGCSPRKAVFNMNRPEDYEEACRMDAEN